MDNDILLERLAALEHEQWCEWSRAVSGEVSEARFDRWARLWVPYDQLSDEAKEKDRDWARKVIEILRRF
jgi:hypothetical protein